MWNETAEHGFPNNYGKDGKRYKLLVDAKFTGLGIIELTAYWSSLCECYFNVENDGFVPDDLIVAWKEV